MAVDEITSTNPVLTAVLPSRNQASVQPARAPAALVAAQELTPAQQAAQLINATLRDLNFVASPPTDELLINETNALVEEIVGTEALTPAQQAALLLNETLQGLNFEPSPATEALLINETSPALTEFLEDLTLTPAQEAAVAVNETLQDQTTPGVTDETTIPIANVAQTLAAAPLAAALVSETAAAGVATAAETAGVGPAGAAAATPATPTAAPVTATTAAAEAQNLTQANVTPAVVDRNIIATPVYEVRDPHPAPPDPLPTRPDLMPTVPIGRVRPVDPLVLRRVWERRKERGRGEEISPRPPLAERSIREMVGRANQDLNANGLPLRLVLARTDEGYSLDIYDCSDEEGVCRLSQEVHLDLNQLLTILDNIQHETGIIVNIKT